MKAYDAYKPRRDAAKPSRELWRLACGLSLIAIGFFALSFLFLGLLRSLADWPQLAEEITRGSTPRAMWIMLASFGALCGALYLALRIFHDRGFRSLLGPLPDVWRDFWRVLRILAILFAVVLVIPAGEDMQPVRTMSVGNWLALLVVSVPLILLQTGTEELTFRGYLQSQLAARFRHPFVWMVVPSLLFGALHYDPELYGGNAVWIALWAVVFGLAAADLTARTGNLGAALALHFVNNLNAMTITSMLGHWDALALFVIPLHPSDEAAIRALMPPEAAMMLCMWLAARIAIRR